jgi:hypothetical protein
MFVEVPEVINVFEPKQHNIRLVISGDYHYKLLWDKRLHMKDQTRNNGYQLKLPKIRLEYSRRSFYNMGAKLYNDLPLIKHSKSRRSQIV